MNKKFLSVFLICALCALPRADVFAQKKNIIKTVTGKPAALKVVERTAAARIPPALQLPVTPPAVRHPRLAQFATKHRRPLIGLQKMVGISTYTAWKNLQSIGAVHIPTNPRPILAQDKTFSSADLTNWIVSRAEAAQAPAFPFDNQRALIYRGMALDGDGKAIRNILENGLRTQDVGKESNTLLISIAGPNAHAAGFCKPVINLTDSSADAVMWANKRLNKNQTLVVTVVKSNDKGDIIVTSDNIPAEDIYALTALLKIDGVPTWCKVELEGEGFKITPYQENPPAEQP